MSITGRRMAELAEKVYHEGYGYIWATSGETWTEKKQQALELKYQSDPIQYADYAQGAKYGKKWIGRKVTDCSGLPKMIGKQLGLKNLYHGSNSQFNKNCKSVGKIVKGVKIPIGALIFTGNEVGQHNHVGILVSETCVCEAKGTTSGVVHTPLSNKKWTYWGLLKGVEYDTEPAYTALAKTETKSETNSAKKTETKITYPTLRRGAKGDLVVQMQDLLAKDGSTLKVDGIFGIGTQTAVKAFQKKHGLVVDGIVGPKTWAELLKLI